MILFIRCKGTNWFLLIPIASILLLLGACNNSRISKLSEKEGAYVGKIILSAGDDVNYIDKEPLGFMAFPMNVAYFKNSRKEDKLVYIVGKSINVDQNVAFSPFALLHYNDKSNTKNTIVIAKPVEAKWTTAEISNFYEFISVHYGVQQVLEVWVRNMNGYGSAKNISWENEEKAIEYLDQ